MDPRIQKHAEVLVDHSVNIESGDTVLIQAPPVAEDLIVALHEQIGKRGANPMISMHSTRARQAFMNSCNLVDFELPDHKIACFEETDVIIVVSGGLNTYETSDVDVEKNAAYRTVLNPLQEIMMEKRWVGTQFPAPGNAQAAEMSTEAYEDFVYQAINKDWETQRKYQQQLVELLDPASELRIRSGETTDLRMSIDGMKTVNRTGKHNMPDGEVFTAPIPESVVGDVLFDMPLVFRGREIQDIYLRFEDGEISEYHAGKNEEVLTAALDTDDGARRLGELGIGMNHDIDRFTSNILFDEKMGETVHMALGQAYEESVGENRKQNDSAIHIDMMLNMAEDSVIEIDGEVIQRDGRFVFEEDDSVVRRD